VSTLERLAVPATVVMRIDVKTPESVLLPPVLLVRTPTDSPPVKVQTHVLPVVSINVIVPSTLCDVVKPLASSKPSADIVDTETVVAQKSVEPV
jgi:hypothetical protein